MKLANLLTLAAFSSCISLSQGAWIWEDWQDSNGDPVANPTGASGSVSIMPVSANYDGGNAVNQFGWDRTPEPFLLEWNSSTPVELDLSFRPGSSSLEYLHVMPTSGVSSYDISITLTFPFDLVVRADSDFAPGIVGSGYGFSLAAVGTTIDSVELSAYQSDGGQVEINNTSGIATLGTVDNATGFVGDYGSVDGSLITPATAGGFHGLSGGALNESTFFPWPDPGQAPDPSKSLGQMSWDLEGVEHVAAESFLRLSFDGGVPELAGDTSQIPEPTSGLLLGLGALSLCASRRR